jgi:DNA-binding response OmpR family regulator
LKILLVEDEPDLGLLLQKNLTHHQYVVDWAQDGEKAWSFLTFSQANYSLAIVDWMLPQMSGVELCRQIRRAAQTIPVLMLTARDRMEDKIVGLDAGADDYLVKPFGLEELLARMRALQRRSNAFQSPNLQVSDLILDYGTNALRTADTRLGYLASVHLSAKEFQLVEYFLQHPGQLLSHDQIRNRVWEMNSEAFSNIIAAQIRLVRKKMAELGYENSIETVRGLGYRFIPPVQCHAEQ